MRNSKMGYPIKTSNNNWLEKALELSYKRINVSITDDANYNLNANSDVMKVFRRFTLPISTLILLGIFYLLALVCMVIFFYSLSAQMAKMMILTLSTLFLFICVGIPTYYLAKNRHPKIEKTENGIDIKFSNEVF